MTARSALASRFERESRNLKTWIVDVHPRMAPKEFLSSMVNGDMRVERKDATLWRLEGDEDLEVFADTLTPRFWRLHSWSSSSRAGSWFKSTVETNPELDRVWLPAGHLRAMGDAALRTRVKTSFGGRLRPDGGSHIFEAEGDWAQDLYLTLADHPKYGGMASVESVEFTGAATEGEERPSVVEKVDRWGRFMAHGWDFKAHERYVSQGMRRYRRLIELVESRSLATRGLPRGGFTVDGSPVTIWLGTQIPNMDFFLSEMFSCREPFRLFGNPREADGYWTVESGDLHVGQRLTLDIGEQWIRAYLRSGVCGNTIVRLASNLEHHLDARVRFADPELQAAFAPDALAQPRAA